MVLTQNEKRDLLKLVRALEKNIGSTDPRNIQRTLYNLWVFRKAVLDSFEFGSDKLEVKDDKR